MKDLLIDEIDKWSEKYYFNFQFQKGINNVALFKDDVELYSSFGHETVEDVMTDVLGYIYRVNRVPLEKRFKSNEIHCQAQNERMREWFEERTGLEDATLLEQMNEIDKVVKGLCAFERAAPRCNAPNVTYCKLTIGKIISCTDCKYNK